jgi:hypothetical protein
VGNAGGYGIGNAGGIGRPAQSTRPASRPTEAADDDLDVPDFLK